MYPSRCLRIDLDVWFFTALPTRFGEEAIFDGCMSENGRYWWGVKIARIFDILASYCRVTYDDECPWLNKKSYTNIKYTYIITLFNVKCIFVFKSYNSIVWYVIL